LLSAAALCASAACSVTTAPASPADPQRVAHAIGHAGGGVILRLGMPSPTPTLRGPKNWPRPWDHLDDPCSAPPVIAHRG